MVVEHYKKGQHSGGRLDSLRNRSNVHPLDSAGRRQHMGGRSSGRSLYGRLHGDFYACGTLVSSKIKRLLGHSGPFSWLLQLHRSSRSLSPPRQKVITFKQLLPAVRGAL